MSNIKLDDRIENAMNAFFETETDRGEFALAYGGNETAIAADDTAFSEKADKWTGWLRGLFLFLPGAFVLFYMTLTIIFFYPGLSFQGLFMFFSGIFLTYAGSGTLKNMKNLAVPGSIIAVAAAVAIVSSLFPAKAQPDLYFWYSIYLFPNALIAAKLIQAWVSDKK